MEALRRRDKSGQACNSDWMNHDQYVLKEIATRVGCNPKYWKISLDLENCWRREQYDLIATEFNRLKKSIAPCKSIERLSQTTYETDLKGTCAFIHPYIGNLMLKIFLNIDTINLYYFYHLYDILGGYVGVFIGYSIAQGPSYLLNLVAWIIAVKNTTRTQNIESDVTED